MNTEDHDLTPETLQTVTHAEDSASPRTVEPGVSSISANDNAVSPETQEPGSGAPPPASVVAGDSASSPASVTGEAPAAEDSSMTNAGPQTPQTTPGIPAEGEHPVSGESAVESETPAEESMSEMERLLDDYSQPRGGDDDVIEGRVLEIRESEIIVDINRKAEGSVPIDQVKDHLGNLRVAVGDVLDVVVVRGADYTKEGYISLSHEKAGRLRAWDNLKKAEAAGLPVLGRVLSRTKGGLIVDVGTKAFMPASHVDVRPVQNLDQFVGQDIPVKILKMNRRRSNVVVSRRAVIEQEVSSRKEQTLAELSEGAIVTGIVKSLTDYGAFVDLGGIDGLLHVSDISYGRIGKPSEVLKQGQELTVKVLKFDREHERVSLGLKQLAPDPWETAPERYPLNYRVFGTVVSITDYGAFLELEPGVEGLVHISEMTWSRRMKHPSKLMKVGDQVEAVVLAVDTTQRRISLGIKQLEVDPWTTVDSRYSVGSVVEGRVRKLSDFGAFIEIEEGIDGLVHISDLSWTKRIKHPSEVVKKGQVLQAVILNIDSANRRLSLGVKQLLPDAWESFFASHQIGDIVEGTVVREANFGYFVEILPNVEGLCHTSEVPTHYVQPDGSPVIAVGMTRPFKIIKLQKEDRRIGLSIKAIEPKNEANMADTGDGATATIGESIQNKSQ
ncbi:MAG: S1 RNA-binding domain-containing protein [Bryobacterales bacterium]|nr:S1 RNA-binding domain-containing protein [Bryobacterales bacterium]